MRPKDFIIVTLIVFFFFSNNATTYSLDKKTHAFLNEKIAQGTMNGFSLNTYLINQLGFKGGVTEIINNKGIYMWIKDGGEYEDEPFYLRSRNHFHNPLKSWDSAGLTDYGSLTSLGFTPMSSVLWAQDQSDRSWIDFGGDWSWKKAREYFYLALTSSDKTTREDNFAHTFRSVGQIMHLVEDASVPAHVRNDTHILGDGYEAWVRNNHGTLNLSPTTYDSSILNETPNPLAQIPIAKIFDTDKYTGANPSTSLSWGIAEYTNSNFFSESSVFAFDYLATTDLHYFPYPRKSSTDLQDYINGNKLPETVTGEDNIPDTTFYIKKERDGEVIEHFVKPGYFTNPLLEMGATDSVFSLSFILDDNVYSNYASLLLPRAVGYSAGLLNYFFRGNMDFTIDANDREDGVKGVKISNSSTEDMNGTFSLYYDTADTNRHLLGSWNISLASQEASQVLSFPFPQDNIPRYTLVFRGKMGTEKDAVTGSRAGWREEWDNGLHGNHTWLHSGMDFLSPLGPNGELMDWQNPLNGQTINKIIDGKLIKENIRYAGSKLPRMNETLIMDAYVKPWGISYPYCIETDYTHCYSYDFGEEFPIPITKDTWISVKIDEISINEAIPYQNCSDGTYGPGGYQAVYIEFDNGITLSFTVPGQEPVIGSGWVAHIEQGKEWSYNIFATFQNAGVEFVEPVNIKSIDVIQQLEDLCEPSIIEHLQRMVVDYIRIHEK